MISSKPLANATFVAANEKGTATEFTTDDQGKFSVPLAPGHYTVSLKNKKGGIGRYGPFDVDVAVFFGDRAGPGEAAEPPDIVRESVGGTPDSPSRSVH